MLVPLLPLGQQRGCKLPAEGQLHTGTVAATALEGVVGTHHIHSAFLQVEHCQVQLLSGKKIAG